MIENFINKKEIYAIVIRRNYKSKGIEFFTPNNFSQQLGYMCHNPGHVISPHFHNSVTREVKLTNEVLFIKKGKVRIDFYDKNQKYLESSILNQGDVILLSSGGHGFEILEKTEMIEVKQGPYIGDKDKTRFIPVSLNKIKFKKK